MKPWQKLLKKGLTISLAATSLLLSLGLAGCSTSAATTAATSASAGPATAQATPTTTAAETVEVEFWHALGGSLGDGLLAIIADYNAQNPGVIIKPVTIGSYSEIDQKLQAAYAAQNTPALVAGGSMQLFYQNDLVTPFEDYMPESYDKEDIVGGFLDAATRDGKMIFAPAYGTSQVIYYNQSALEKSEKSVSDLASWQQLVASADAIIGQKTGKDAIEYVWEPMWGPGNVADIVSSAGGTYLSEDGKTVTINSPEWVEVMEAMRQWIHEDKIMRIHSGGQGWEYWYKTMDDWVYGKSLGYTGSPGDYAIALEAVTKAVADGYDNQFAVAPQPGWGDNEPAPYFGSLMYFIPNSKNVSEAQKTAAADFVAFATSTENTARFSIATGYVAVRRSVLDLPEYQDYLKTHPDADAALVQIDRYAVPEFIDPTGGAIETALQEAVDKVQIENMPVQAALDEAQAIAQAALDKQLGS
ncbi:MAG: extracellular solute-binding protein [Clostridia bacterium]|nr:extracellular solute-binding protein [Clostridia bacterium]